MVEVGRKRTIYTCYCVVHSGTSYPSHMFQAATNGEPRVKGGRQEGSQDSLPGLAREPHASGRRLPCNTRVAASILFAGEDGRYLLRKQGVIDLVLDTSR